jgi:polysaccharide export outer membrane protein
MIEYFRKMAGHWVLALGVVFVTVLSGCQTGSHHAQGDEGDIGTKFHIGDMIAVTFLPLSGETPLTHTERIGEDGNITLLYIGTIKAEGKTATQLQKEIHELYVPKLYKGGNVVVTGDTRYFYIDGEVRMPGGKEVAGDMTVVKAIAVAGGFTDFANKKRVQITHAGKTRIVNVPKAIDHPELDVQVYAGDKIWVPRRLW